MRSITERTVWRHGTQFELRIYRMGGFKRLIRGYDRYGQDCYKVHRSQSWIEFHIRTHSRRIATALSIAVALKIIERQARQYLIYKPDKSA